MDALNITQALHTKINTASTTEEVLILSKAIEQLKLGNVKTVATYTGLNDQFPKLGDVFFVEDETKLYYSMGQSWYSIFDPTAFIAYGFGTNTAGTVGDGTAANKSSPVSVVGGIADWIQIDASSGHSIGLRDNGTIWTWGTNTNGQLGNNASLNSSSPVSVIGGFTDWVQVAAGSTHSLAIRANGTLWAWGSNSVGRLGDGTIVSKSSPASVLGGFTDWTQVSANGNQSMAIRSSGILYAWGNGAGGRLGDNSVTDKSSPVLVLGGFTDWVQVSVGGAHSLAIRSTNGSNGILYAWGLGSFGRLGVGTDTADRSSPVSVVGGFTDWTQASAGGSFSMAIRANGTLWSWGINTSGALGENSAVAARSSPVSVVGGFTDWVQCSAGSNVGSGVRANGTLWNWGANNAGQLGDNTTVSKSSPVLVAGGLTGWISTSAYSHNISLKTL